MPAFLINDKNIINIKYECEGLHSEKINDNDLQDIQSHKFKCINCDELLLKAYKNYLCSNCKEIIWHFCSQKHFEKCVTIFLISIEQIDRKCSDHNENYEEYCELCQINLCKKCLKEHCHYIGKETDNNLTKEQIIKLEEIIKNDSKNDKIIKASIENIIKNEGFQKNFQFVYFLKKILGIHKKKAINFLMNFSVMNFKIIIIIW